MNFENMKICAVCGGKCCKRMPGICFPEDFDNDQSKIKAAIDSGRYCVDWFENFDDQGYYVRPATVGNEGKKRDPSWGGQCTFLTSHGCKLDHDNRPIECRMLEPVAEDGCKVHLDRDNMTAKEYASKQWADYQGFLGGIE